MTGRRLYDALTDAWAERGTFQRERGAFLKTPPPAWAFLTHDERQAISRAASRLTPTRRAKRG